MKRSIHHEEVGLLPVCEVRHLKVNVILYTNMLKKKNYVSTDTEKYRQSKSHSEDKNLIKLTHDRLTAHTTPNGERLRPLTSAVTTPLNAARKSPPGSEDRKAEGRGTSSTAGVVVRGSPAAPGETGRDDRHPQPLKWSEGQSVGRLPREQ